MYGSDINRLNVNIIKNNRQELLWTRYGQHGNVWNRASVDIVASSNSFELILEGVRGSDYNGDIAIDDISYSASKCSGNCIDALFN